MTVAASINRVVHKILTRFIGDLGPLPIQIDITNGCNLTCSHCYHPDHINKYAMTYHQILNVVDQYGQLLKKTGFQPYFIICGGEPLLSRHFIPIVNYLSNHFEGCSISVLTNGTLISKELIEKIVHLKRLRFQVSLDGFDEISHDQVRGKGSFIRSTTGIRLLKENGFRVQTMTVLSKRTSERIEAFFALGKSLGVDGVCFTRFIPLGVGQGLVESNADRTLTPIELKKALQEIVIASGIFEIHTNLHQPLFNLLHPSLGANSKFAEAIIVDYQGNILLSSRSRFKLGNAFCEGIEHVFVNHPLLKSLRRGQVEGCQDCSHYSKCGGDRNVAFAETGSFLKKDPGCWIATG